MINQKLQISPIPPNEHQIDPPDPSSTIPTKPHSRMEIYWQWTTLGHSTDIRILCVPGVTSSNAGQAKAIENASSAKLVSRSTNRTECSLRATVAQKIENQELTKAWGQVERHIERFGRCLRLLPGLKVERSIVAVADGFCSGNSPESRLL